MANYDVMGIWDPQRKAIVGSYSLLLTPAKQAIALDRVLERNSLTAYELVPVEQWTAKQAEA